MPTLKARIGGAWVPVGGGSSASEVEVSPSDPIGTNPSAELWYDSDAPAALSDDLRWNTAWGVVATETTSLTVTDGTAVANNVVLCGINGLTLVSGRRYRLTFQIRAMESGGTSGAFVANLAKNGSLMTPGQAVWFQNQGNYESTVWTFNLTGDGSTANYTIIANNVLGTTLKVHLSGPAGNILIVEDIGPVAGTVPAMPPNTDARWNTAWGVVAVDGPNFTDVSIVNNTSGAVVSSLTFAPVAGRRYRASFQGTGVFTVANMFIMRLAHYGASTMLAEQRFTTDAANTQVTISAFADSMVFTAPSVTLQAVAYSYGGGTLNINGATYASPWRFVVEDVGPVAGAVPIPNPTPAWTAVTFQNGWVNYGAPLMGVAYRLVGDKVEVRGAASNPTPIAQDTQSVIFTLPVGHRPSGLLMFPAVFGDAGSGGAGRVDVAADGSVTVSTSARMLGPHVFTSLNIQFSVTA